MERIWGPKPNTPNPEASGDHQNSEWKRAVPKKQTEANKNPKSNPNPKPELWGFFEPGVSEETRGGLCRGCRV